MSIRTWFRTPRVRRGLAAGAVVLAAGGLVLFRAPAGAQTVMVGMDPGHDPLPSGPNSVQFSGPKARGAFSLSHTRVLAGGERRMFGELRIAADAADRAVERAPLSMAIVIDTSGSMDGEKIQQARESVVRMIRDMRDDDEIALVRYSTDSELVQSMARVGDVRERLIDKVLALKAGGGTNIAPALSHGVRALDEASERSEPAPGGREHSPRGRVRRVVLVSDGLDSTRAQSEATARDSADRGITVSAMGIGLDFDESYMSSVAGIGHGNFAFVKDGAALASFLTRELKEGATTTVENARARIRLPAGVRLVRAVGADVRDMGGGEISRERSERRGEAEGRAENVIELRFGSLFAGDERSVVVELAARMDSGEVKGIEGDVSWEPVGADRASARIERLELAGTTSASAVDESRDGAVYARAVSALASLRQMEAASAYAAGDGRRAEALIDQNMADLAEAGAGAPPAAATAIAAQSEEYKKQKGLFRGFAPGSAPARQAAKASVAKDSDNLGRKAAF